MEEEEEGVFKAKSSRSTHRKSRDGCIQCKKRRVKCDESKPACDNCTRRSTPCQYAPRPNVPANFTAAARQDETSLSGSWLEPGRTTPKSPSSYGQSSSVSSPHFSHDGGFVSQALPTIGGFDLFDLELWHYWMTTVSYTLTEDTGSEVAWNQNITKIAFGHSYVAQLILATSALHLSRADESRKPACIARSNAHQSNAISGMMSVMSKGTGTNPTELYVAACMLVFCSFGKGPQPGQYLVYSDDAEPEWLGLLQGVKSILEQHRQVIFPEVRPTFHPNDNIDRRVDPDEMLPGVHKQLDTLRTSIEAFQAEDPSLEKYLTALNSLQECLSGTFERDGESTKVCTHMIFAWIYRCKEDYLSSLQTKRPMALVILAHYVVMLNKLRDMWYMGGWIEHIIDAITRHLHPSYQRWLDWPKQHI